MLFAGFGGQGVLFAGKVAAYAGMLAGKEITWLPSYGPEMRGGTANCSVCISEEPIGAPIVTNPNVFVAMNLPSLDKFIDDVEPGGVVVIDSSLIDKKVRREDLKIFYLPASQLAEENQLNGLSNIILLGKVFGEIEFGDEALLDRALEKCVPARKAEMLAFNRKAVRLGAAN